MTDAVLCGLRVAGDLSLPELLPWTGDDRAPDLTIRLGEVPPIAEPVCGGPLLQVAADGSCRFEVAAVAAYRVDAGGREITIAPAVDSDSPDVRVFLFGTVFAIVCFRRNLLPLHASVVKIAGKAVAFSGASGAGKSTLAAAFLKRGYAILADDVAVVDPAAPGRALVWPAMPRLKLWRDMMDGFAFDTDGLERARVQLEKYHLPVETFAPEPVPLAAVYHLVEAREQRHEEMRLLSGVEAFLALDRAVYRRQLGLRLVGKEELFARSRAAASAVRSVRLSRLVSLARADAIVDQIAARETAA